VLLCLGFGSVTAIHLPWTFPHASPAGFSTLSTLPPQIIDMGTYCTLLLPNGRVVALLTAKHGKGYTDKTTRCPHDSNSTPDSADPIWFLGVYTTVTNHPM